MHRAGVVCIVQSTCYILCHDFGGILAAWRKSHLMVYNSVKLNMVLTDTWQ